MQAGEASFLVASCKEWWDADRYRSGSGLQETVRASARMTFAMIRLSNVLRAGAVVALAALAAVPVRAEETASAPQPVCSVPAELSRLDYSLPYVARRLAAGLPIKIV